MEPGRRARRRASSARRLARAGRAPRGELEPLRRPWRALASADAGRAASHDGRRHRTPLRDPAPRRPSAPAPPREPSRPAARRADGGPAALPAGHRARAPGRRLGPLGARRGRVRPHARRLLLPPVVPLRGRGRSSTCPTEGGALLVSNHSGALPPDAAMIAKAIKEEHPRPRPLQPHGRALLQGLPGLLHAAAEDRRACRRTRPTCTACCYDEGQLVLVFPEGRKGTEKLYRDRYRLRRFGRGGFVEAAMRAGCRSSRSRWSAPRRRSRSSRTSGCSSAHAAYLRPDHADLPAPRAARDARLPPGEVQDPLPARRAHRRHGRRAVGGQGARADGRRTTSARRSRRSSTTWSASARSVWLG